MGSLTMILQLQDTIEESYRQSVCFGTNCKKSENLELKMVKKQTKTMLKRKTTENIKLRYFHMGWSSTIYLQSALEHLRCT
jgi:hypothetical protein